MKCAEAPDEPETKSKETLFQLSCFISQGMLWNQQALCFRSVSIIIIVSKSLSDKICFLFIFFIFSDVKYMHTGLVSVSIPLSLIFIPAVKSSRIY